jgi:hypothetical protein
MENEANYNTTRECKSESGAHVLEHLWTLRRIATVRDDLRRITRINFDLSWGMAVGHKTRRYRANTAGRLACQT